MAKHKKDTTILSIARELNGATWCEEYEKMVSGMNYDQFNPDIFKSQLRTRELAFDFNNRDLRMDGYVEKQRETLQKMLGKIGQGTYIRAPFTPDHGCNIVFGSNCFVNFNLTILDTSLVIIGDRVTFGTNVSLITATQETSVLSRMKFVAYGLPIRIEDDCWIGAGVTVLPGVTIGRGSTIGAASVVTRDIPPYSVAVGSPARVIKTVQTVEEEREDPSNPYRDLPDKTLV
ncbi:hypothetical protein E1B28_012052 [Marasmius oreades]|uniref:Maltose/galactoside acetyltransferase domain-containing protein n=1 Tax=Marasmius oreades TaxID=181124 RepID=A0A9P7RRJ4_9AGAR|nr:uncharacterized protein E1B28_012052 [Marasmius oreades]KAG7088015.1 hypothetical protein E1B28_012052 [Marasmius oreades]